MFLTLTEGPEISDRSADVVIVGGGVVGACVAWQLARRGCRDVVVLDQGARPGEGSTGRATGGFRAQFGTAINVRLSLLARAELLTFADATGIDPGYDPRGYLFLAETEAQMRALRDALEVQRAAGLDASREVGPEEAGAINPAIALERVLGGTFCPLDGFVRPTEILRGAIAAAEARGVRFRWGAACRAIRVERGRVAGVATDGAEWAAGRVVIAAGAWSGRVAALAGAHLPVEPLRRQVAATRPFDGVPAGMPMTIWPDGFHLRVRDGRVLLLWPRESPAADPFDTRFDPAWLEGLHALAARRVPALAEAAVDAAASWAGLYEMSPDGHAILGPAPEVEGLFYAAGSSGHGVMHAPALGLLLAEILLDGAARAMDVRPLRPARFAEGDPNPDGALL